MTAKVNSRMSWLGRGMGVECRRVACTVGVRGKTKFEETAYAAPVRLHEVVLHVR